MTWSTDAKIALIALFVACFPGLFFLWRKYNQQRHLPRSNSGMNGEDDLSIDSDKSSI